MILRMPSYCRDFRCLAGACSDSCCIGWEIDIDDKTADYYMSLSGDFGERLRSSISSGDCYSFILDNERCPFLNKDNLCDIILNLGEDKLCHICNEHPRYYEWFDGVVEGGVGLCCEEAARLILEKGGEGGYCEKHLPDEKPDDYDKDLFSFLYEARETIIEILRKGSSLKDDVREILGFVNAVQSCIDNGETGVLPDIYPYDYTECTADIWYMMRIFRNLEPIDERWKPYIDRLEGEAKAGCYTEQQEKYIRNTGIYFIWRYFLKGVFDEEILSKAKLAVISMAMAGLMFGSEKSDELRQCAILAKNYSKEIEYSEENLEALYDMTYTEKVFKDESLIAFF